MSILREGGNVHVLLTLHVRYGVIFAQSIGVGEPFTINTIIYVVQIVTVGLSVVFGNKMNRRTNL